MPEHTEESFVIKIGPVPPGAARNLALYRKEVSRQLAQLEKDAARRAGNIERSLARATAAAGQGRAQGGRGTPLPASALARKDPGGVRIAATRPTGEKVDPTLLGVASFALGAAALPTGGLSLPLAVGRLLLGGGALAVGGQDEQITRFLTLNEAAETYKKNLQDIDRVLGTVREGENITAGGLPAFTGGLKRLTTR